MKKPSTIEKFYVYPCFWSNHLQQWMQEETQMKKALLVLLMTLVAVTAFAGKIGGNAGVSVMFGTQLDQELSENNILMFGFYAESINTLGREGKVEFALGARVDVCTENMEFSNIALSAVAGVGASINFTDSLSLYVMPGFGSYFLTGYKDKAATGEDVQLNLLGIGLMTGLRFEIGESGFVLNLSGSGIYPISALTVSNEQKSSLLFTAGAGVGVSF